MKSQIIVAYAAQTRRRVKRPQMRQSKPTPLTLTFIQEICHLQRLTNRKQQYVSIDAANLNYLTSCLNGRLGSFESLRDCAAVTKHYACVDCWGIFLVSDEPCADGCRLALWWGTHLCLGPAGRPLAWSGRHIWTSLWWLVRLPVLSTNTVNTGIPRHLF